MGKKIYYGNTGLAKFGRSGNEGKTLAFYMNDNGTWEGIPFGHVRNSNAFEENDGVLTEVGIDVPRFQDGKYFTEGGVNQQLGKTNDFNDVLWENTEDTTVTISSVISPVNGSSFWELIPGATDDFHRISQSTPQTTSLDYSFSLIVKRKGNDYFILRTNKGTGVNLNTCFNLANGTIEFDGIGNAKIRELAYDSYEISVVFEALDIATRVYLLSSPNVWRSNSITSFTGNGVDGAYICEANHKQESVLSSLVKNDTTSPNSRQADTGIRSLVDLSEQINSEEGVIEFKIAANTNGGGGNREMSLGGDFDNKIGFGYDDDANEFSFFVKTTNEGVFVNTDLIIGDQTEDNVFKIKYKSGDIGVKQNGTEIFTDTSTFSFSTLLNAFALGSQDLNPLFNFYGLVDYVIIHPNISNY